MIIYTYQGTNEAEKSRKTIQAVKFFKGKGQGLQGQRTEERYKERNEQR